MKCQKTMPTGSVSRLRKPAGQLDKEAWLKIAVEWLKLAQSVDGRRDKR
jgi:hypothetical protein